LWVVHSGVCQATYQSGRLGKSYGRNTKLLADLPAVLDSIGAVVVVDGLENVPCKNLLLLLMDKSLNSDASHGRAVFCSPRKVKEACDQQQLKEREEEQLQRQKLEANRLCKEARQEKLQVVQIRRQVRAAARLVREKEMVKKAAE
jgi:hypothetical protein